MPQLSRISDVAAVTPDGLRERATIVIDGGRIDRVESSLVGVGERGTSGTAERPPARADQLDGSGLLATPGFVDTHFHGIAGHDATDATELAWRAMARTLPRYGVTSFCFTIPPTPDPVLDRCCDLAVAQSGKPADDEAELIGLHWESPYVNPAIKGGLDDRYMCAPDVGRARAVLARAGGTVRHVTVAPELAGAAALAELFQAAGVVVGIGHSLADYETVRAAIRRGARRATHFFNAMRGLGHREPGVVGAYLDAEEQVCLELIADGHHVHAAAARLAARARGPAGICLITDAVRPTATSMTSFELSPGLMAEVRDGRTWLPPDGALAGSILTMDVAYRNFASWTGATLAATVAASSANAARSLGLERKGALVAGHDADIVLLDAAGVVRATVVRGRLVYRAESRPPLSS